MHQPAIDLYVIRHAESAANASGSHLIGGRSNESPLTEKGVEQAKYLGQYLLAKDITPDFIYSSPAVRTLQTAHYALTEMGIASEPTVDDNLQELDQGLWVGRNRKDTYTEEVLSNIQMLGKDFKSDGGESMNEVGERMLAAISSIADRHAHEGEIVTGIIFTHGVAIRCLASRIHDWSHRRTYETETPNASVSLFTRSGGEWNVQSFAKNTRPARQAPAR
jgi:broad specificity phosphatase PhoE